MMVLFLSCLHSIEDNCFKIWYAITNNFFFLLVGKLMELHGEGSSSGKATGDETGAKVERADGYEPPVQESV